MSLMSARHDCKTRLPVRKASGTKKVRREGEGAYRERQGGRKGWRGERDGQCLEGHVQRRVAILRLLADAFAG